MIRLALALGAIVATGVASAVAQEIPRFDVEKHCEEVASVSGSSSSMIYNGCIDMEQSSYNSIKKIWGDLDNKIKEHCHEVASFSEPGSYSIYKGCIDMEKSAKENKSEFKF